MGFLYLAAVRPALHFAGARPSHDSEASAVGMWAHALHGLRSAVALVSGCCEHLGFAAPWHGIFWTRDRAHVPCSGKVDSYPLYHMRESVIQLRMSD